MLRIAVAALLLSVSSAWAGGSIAVEEAYAISPVPGAPSGAAYMIIRNSAETADRLLSVRSPVARSVELHGHEEVDGVMRMRPIAEPVELPAGGEARLERGGIHVMFMGVLEPFEDGEVIPVTLVFESAGEMTVDVPVDFGRLTGEPSADHDGEGAGHAHHGHGG